MPIKKRENLYKGVNAHFMSQCFNPADKPSMWHSFHTQYISDITGALNEQLSMDYVARPEQSLQIWIDDIDNLDSAQRKPVPDTSIFRVAPRMPKTLASDIDAVSGENVRILEVRDTLSEQVIISSVIIYKPDSHGRLGEPVTRIELLSPSNKEGSGKQVYLANRTHAILGGTSLVEIDFIHTLPPIFAGLETYPIGDDSHPYWIGITDERKDKNLQQVMLIYVFGVDDPIPQKISIPLADDDTLEFDFNLVYAQTYVRLRCGSHVDYAELPPLFDTYSPKDQDRIKAVMERAKKE
ncbi:MAG: DUF4058 family protein [bacterium]|nr:DUF4058 family protein [bacterium]